LQAIDRKAER